MKIRITASLFTLTALLWPAVAFAQSDASQETTIPGGVLVLITYFVFVALMMGYIAVLHIRQRKLDQDIEALEKRLDELAELS